MSRQQIDPFVVVYRRIVDDPAFAPVWASAEALGWWLRLKLGAGATWPSSAEWPPGCPPAVAAMLEGAGIIVTYPGGRYRMPGYDLEREAWEAKRGAGGRKRERTATRDAGGRFRRTTSEVGQRGGPARWASEVGQRGGGATSELAQRAGDPRDSTSSLGQRDPAKETDMSLAAHGEPSALSALTADGRSEGDETVWVDSEPVAWPSEPPAELREIIRARGYEGGQGDMRIANRAYRAAVARGDPDPLGAGLERFPDPDPRPEEPEPHALPEAEPEDLPRERPALRPYSGPRRRILRASVAADGTRREWVEYDPPYPPGHPKAPGASTEQWNGKEAIG